MGEPPASPASHPTSQFVANGNLDFFQRLDADFLGAVHLVLVVCGSPRALDTRQRRLAGKLSPRRPSSRRADECRRQRIAGTSVGRSVSQST